MDVFRKIGIFNQYLYNHSLKYHYPYKLFGIFGVITYPLFYVFWDGLSTQNHLSIFLRLIAVIMCATLMIHDYWPKKLKKFLSLYWYVTILYCLPFTFTVLSLHSGLSSLWLLNSLTVVVLTILLLDTLSFFIILLLGMMLGLLFYRCLLGEITYTSSIGYHYVLLSYASIIVFGAIFSYKKYSIQEKKLRLTAEKSNEVKSAFIANMSHDLRTPVSGISGMLQGLLYEVEDVQRKLESASYDDAKLIINEFIGKVEHYTQIANSSCDELIKLFDDILDVSRLEFNGVSVEQDYFDIYELAYACEQLCKPIAERKGLQFFVVIDQDVPRYLFGSSKLLKRVLLNIISNGLKFTNKGYVKLSISKETQNSQLILKAVISDTGIGIPKHQQEIIFEKFSRLTPSYEGVYKGAGLGLFEVKQYISAMNGHIDVVSEDQNGTTFYLELPFRQYKQNISNQTENDDKQNKEVAHKSTAKPTVLLVEDNTIAAMAGKLIIEHSGCDVDIATSGKEALRLIDSHCYDLIFMDVGLPDCDGISVAEAIRAHKNTNKACVPIIALTGHASESVKRACLKARMNTILIKPATENKVNDMLDKYVNKRAVTTDYKHCK